MAGGHRGESVRGRERSVTEIANGKQHPHRAHIPSRETPYRVQCWPLCVHGREPFGTEIVHGARRLGRGCRKVFTVGTVACREVYTAGERAPRVRAVGTVTWRKVYAVDGGAARVRTTGNVLGREVYTGASTAARAYTSRRHPPPSRARPVTEEGRT